MTEAAAAPERKEPGFAVFRPAPPHPLRRQLARDGPGPLATEGVVDPGPSDRREPLLGSFIVAGRHPLRRDPLYRPTRSHLPLPGPAGSLALHALALALILVGWHSLPKREPPPIEVQLVTEVPKPAPPPAPMRPRPGPLASIDVGDTAPKPSAEKPVEAPPAKPVAEKPIEAPPAPKPAPEPPTPPLVAPQPAAPTPTPLDLPQVAAALTPPLPPAKPHPPASRPAPAAVHQARFPGPSATRDEYVAYCFMLIQRHAGLLSRAMVGERRGEAVVVFDVHDDGRISGVQVRGSSGYTDIDRRIMEMVIAVGHFPPLPQWFQGDAFHFTLTQVYPPSGG